jgi:hypothetical protein
LFLDDLDDLSVARHNEFEVLSVIAVLWWAGFGISPLSGMDSNGFLWLVVVELVVTLVAVSATETVVVVELVVIETGIICLIYFVFAM